eukprot:GGOE01043446.1.p1 GENE.GGOE01043446.1~~GGOE01043446.1.p1  ORF type:complete len:481 (-),score=156.81 GGOE01043446.1:113-1555(-)
MHCSVPGDCAIHVGSTDKPPPCSSLLTLALLCGTAFASSIALFSPATAGMLELWSSTSVGAAPTATVTAMTIASTGVRDRRKLRLNARVKERDRSADFPTGNHAQTGFRSPVLLAWGCASAAFFFAAARWATVSRDASPPHRQWLMAATTTAEDSVHTVNVVWQPQEYTVVAFYKFALLADYRELQQQLQEFCGAQGLCGTILLAREGINSTVAGSAEGIQALLAHLRSDPRLADLEAKFSIAHAKPFRKMKVRVKKEIVTMGVEDVDPARGAVHVEPKDWNALLRDPEAFIIDVRNTYEYRIGTFEGSVDPLTKNFREFPEYVKSIPEAKKKKVVMYCTGGIRCEKAGAYMIQQGFDRVYQLKGGILKYLEEIPEEESMWKGQCFVFDRRVAVQHGVTEGDYDMCFACGEPVDEGDEQSPLFEAGVSCPRCHSKYSEADKLRFRERVRQMLLAKARLDRGESPGPLTAFSSKLWSILPR